MVSWVFLALGICFLYFFGVPVSYRTGRLGGLIFFFFFLDYLLVGFLRIWQWASQSDLPSSHDVLVQPQFALQNMTRGVLTRMRPKMLLPLLKSHPQVPWEKSLMFPWLDTVLEEQAMAGRRQAWAALKPC